MTTWLITGCSTGLGRALAQQVLERDTTPSSPLAMLEAEACQAVPDTRYLPLDANECGTDRFGGRRCRRVVRWH